MGIGDKVYEVELEGRVKDDFQISALGIWKDGQYKIEDVRKRASLRGKINSALAMFEVPVGHPVRVHLSLRIGERSGMEMYNGESPVDK